MLFHSFDFAVFLPLVFGLYWFVFSKSIKQQNLVLVVASYVFYGWWDWRFLLLIFFSSMVDFVISLQLGKTMHQQNRKYLLWASLVLNLGLLGVFKYYNFFLDSFQSAFSWLGVPVSGTSLELILPVGISFYTFQTLSYTIDVYRRQLTPTKDLVAFIAFVSFFPQLVAGPIERATNLLPQFFEERTFSYQAATDGLRQILWGLFKKMVVADICAEVANLVFENSDTHAGSTLFIGALAFAFQIYGDFSGYSDIAIGTSRLFGIRLMQNFAFPYFSRNIAEFWRRWHISLSTWFRDYVYIPLGGSRGSKMLTIRNTFILFLVSGLWHGANWTFVAWGALHALFFLPLLLTRTNRRHFGLVAEDRSWPTLRDTGQMVFTFLLVVLGWVFFRADSVPQALSIVDGIFSRSFFQIPELELKLILPLAVILLFFMLVEWRGRAYLHPLANLDTTWSRPWRHFFYYALVAAIFLLAGSPQQFIYFQF